MLTVIFLVTEILFLDFQGIYKQASMPRAAHELLESIWEQVLQRSDDEISELIKKPSGVLFDAAMSGNAEFLAVLLCKYPDLLWEVDENGRSVFHVAIMYRQEHIFNLIYNIGTMKDYIEGNTDKDGNNMLHLVGMLPDVGRLGAPRANLQMQRELLWYKVFILTSSYIYLLIYICYVMYIISLKLIKLC